MLGDSRGRQPELAGGVAVTVGIVITAFNCERYIAEAIQSVRGQSYQTWECVVIDDGSTDETEAAARAAVGGDDRFRVVSQMNAGEGGARNAGFGLLSECVTYVMFLDADDVLERDALATLVAASAMESVIGAHGLADRIDSRGDPLGLGVSAAYGRSRVTPRMLGFGAVPRAGNTERSGQILRHTLFPPAVMLVKKEVYAAVGAWTRLPLCADWEMNLRVLERGDLAYVDAIVVRYRLHAAGATARASNSEWRWLLRCVLLDALANASDRSGGHRRRIARRTWRAHQVMCACDVIRELQGTAGQPTGLEIVKTAGRILVYMMRWIYGKPSARSLRASRRTLDSYRNSLDAVAAG